MRTTLAQKDPHDLGKKIASYIMYVSNIRKSKKIVRDDLIVAMDETSVFSICFQIQRSLQLDLNPYQ
ncbi:hypothetical protein QE152_g9592 [Popillia japonica]|uniref:Uncharacterized protein n=1 Tax=Popillia japonica TaxID=7064 RepID=A0AAW1LXL4_POPJA